MVLKREKKGWTSNKRVGIQWRGKSSKTNEERAKERMKEIYEEYYYGMTFKSVHIPNEKEIGYFLLLKDSFS